jgi:hypothetical protein
MKKSFILVLIVIGALMLAGPAIAQSDSSVSQPQPAGSSTSSFASGKVLSTSASELMIADDTGVQQKFVLDGSTALPATVNTGDRVDVEYMTEADGQLHAVKVENRSTEAPAGGTQPPASMNTSGAAKGTGVADSQAGQGEAVPPSNEMPRTASPLPLVALIGVLAIAAALTLRVAAR